MSQSNVSLKIQNITGYEIIFRNFYYLIITERIFKDITKYKNKKQEKNYFLYSGYPANLPYCTLTLNSVQA